MSKERIIRGSGIIDWWFLLAIVLALFMNWLTWDGGPLDKLFNRMGW
jgi:hypothetical protein